MTEDVNPIPFMLFEVFLQPLSLQRLLLQTRVQYRTVEDDEVNPLMVKALISRPIVPVKIIDKIIVYYMGWYRGVVLITYIVVPRNEIIET